MGEDSSHNRIAENTAAIKENTLALGKLTLEFQNWQTRLAIDRRTPKERKAPRCRNPKCNAELKWPEPYVRGSHTPPVNLDNTKHVCPEGTQP